MRRISGTARMASNNSMQRTALRAAAEPDRPTAELRCLG